MAAGRPTRRRARQPRPLTERQVYLRLRAVLDELVAIGGGHQLTGGQIRRRVLRLQQVVQELLDRWPET